jgi:hypothetical protein
LTEGNATQVQPLSIAERYGTMNAEDFRQEITRKWNATENVLTPIFQAVEDGHYNPVEAGKAVACIVGEVFGYAEFHGGLLSMPPTELIAQLRGLLGTNR